MTSDLTFPKFLYHTLPIIHSTDGSFMPISDVGHASTPDSCLPRIYLIHKLTLNLLSNCQLCDMGIE